MRSDHLGAPVADLAIILPAAGLQASLEGDELALPQVLTADIREAVPRYDVVVFGLFFTAAVVVGRHRELVLLRGLTKTGR